MKTQKRTPRKVTIVGGLLVLFGALIVLFLMLNLFTDLFYGFLFLIWPGTIFVIMSIFYIVLGLGIMRLDIRARNVGVPAFSIWLLAGIILLYQEPGFLAILSLWYVIFGLSTLILEWKSFVLK